MLFIRPQRVKKKTCEGKRGGEMGETRRKQSIAVRWFGALVLPPRDRVTPCAATARSDHAGVKQAGFGGKLNKKAGPWRAAKLAVKRFELWEP